MKQTMKYLSMAALVVMGVILASCAKNESTEVVEPAIEDNIVVCTTTVSFDTDATKALTEHGVKTFAPGDRIAVIYKNTNEPSETVKAVSEPLPSGSYDHTATFTVELTNPAANSAVRIIYPAAMAAATVATDVAVNDDATINYAALNTQDGTLASLSSNLDLAVYDGNLSDTSLPADPALHNKLAICKYTLKDNAVEPNDITSSITGMSITVGTYKYSVTRSAASGPIYVAIRPTADATVNYTATNGKVYYTKTVTGKTYAASEIYQLGLRMAALPEGSLPGKFTVASGKQVYFSKGNLQATYDGSAWTWAFATHQWDYIGENVANTSIGSTGTVDLFGWSSSSTYYGISSSTDYNDYSGVFVDWGNNIGPGWHTLSSTEWTYLFGHNTRGWSTVNGNGGYVIRPDDVITAVASSYTDIEWATEEANGSIFLPAAGFRSGNTVNSEGEEGYYHSSTPSGDYNKYILFFDVYYLAPADNNLTLNLGMSVRLVFPCTPYIP